MYTVDLHTHTRFFHGFDRAAEVYDPVGFRLLAAAARHRGLDGLALTNHDYYRAFDGAATELTVVPGIEISTTDGHVLVVGPDPPTETDPGTLTPAEAVSLAHDRGCAAIIAHPYRNSTVRESAAPFDAVEINGKNPRTWERIEAVAEERDLSLVGGSDAHYPFEVGRAHTVVHVDERSPEAVVAAIRDGAVSTGVEFGLPTRVLHRFYREVHRWKGHDDAA